ncbi:CYTH domain-containing protein [Marinomonas rhizomae]|uniref:CYTH domain-containing protein n=1 Tax=Marinomonas rhizomae TaxID=491948 RepID=A0A366J7Z9_9GAMM|nr:CYTH domain-containing protein [Marinomonas rhizomae]RBP82479.1 CYTH domain-containing protein [Marinomonas rhizomae]RNF73729.1 CYTH domain-containing protein [Marinomonas rhizomae]
MATELELKLMLHPEYLKSASDFLDEICASSDTEEQSRQPTLALMNAYFDTENAELMQGGMALRIRAVNNKFIQTVKTRGSNRIGMHARGEWEWFVSSDQLDLSLLSDVPLPESLQDMSWCSKLIEVYRTDFERQVWNIQSHETKMEVVCDQGLVTSPYGEDAICELELELKEGDESGLYQFALQLADRVPVQVSIVSKAQKGVRLKYGQIEFPQKPDNTSNPLELAAYWYEVWLVYWEAMYFMEDEALMQPLRHSMSQLKTCVPSDLAQELDSLDKKLERQLIEEDNLLLKNLAGMTQVGVTMLMIGQWLNKQV